MLCLEAAVLSFNVPAVAALIPSISQTFNMPEFVVGRIVWVYMLSYGIAALIYGPLTRTLNAKYIELVCLLLFSLANIAAGIAGVLNILFLSRFFMGVFGASVIPLALILIARHVEVKDRGRSVGMFFSAGFLASLLGLFLSGIIHWRWIFLLPGISGLILCVFIYLLFPDFDTETKMLKINYLPALSNKSVFHLMLYIFLISALYHGIQGWLGVYFSQDYQLNQFLISLLLTVASLSGIFGEVIGGYLSDKIGRIKTVNLGVVLMIFSVAALIFRPQLLLFFLMTIWGLGWTFNHSSVSTILTDLPKEYVLEAASLNSAVRFFSGGLGVALGGILMQRSFNLGFIIFGLGLILLTAASKKMLIAK